MATKKKVVTGEANPRKATAPIVNPPAPYKPAPTEDPTTQAQAITKEDVEGQDSRTRLWQSLKQGYDYEKENTDKEYTSAYKTADLQAQSRGMGRSSYNNQTLANINTQKAKALENIDNRLIADYQNRIGQLEQQEKEDERWERQFASQQEQQAWERQYQEGRAKAQDEQWEKSFGYQQGRDKTADEQWLKSFEAQQAQQAWQQAYQEGRATAEDEQWAKAFEAQQAQQAWQQAFSEKQFASEAEQQAWQRAFSEKQWEAQQDQWKQEFDYTKMSTQQKLSFEVLMTAAQQGKDVSDELLKSCGISRQDYDAMKKKAAASGGKKPTTPTGDPTDTGTPTDQGFIGDLGGAPGYGGVYGDSKKGGGEEEVIITTKPYDLAALGLGGERIELLK